MKGQRRSSSDVEDQPGDAHAGAIRMAKGMNAKKNDKKKPQKTPAEKKAAKAEKKKGR